MNMPTATTIPAAPPSTQNLRHRSTRGRRQARPASTWFQNLLLAAAVATPALLATTPTTAADTSSVASNNTAEARAAVALDAPILRALNQVDDLTRRYHQHIVTLSNPYLQGRGTGSPGNDLAADYIAWYFERAGLLPLFPIDATTTDNPNSAASPIQRSTYLQPFSVGSRAVAEAGELSMTTDDPQFPNATFAINTDFTLLGVSGNGRINAPLAFVGYAIESGPNGYTSFDDNADLTGHIAVLFRFEPVDDAGRSRFIQAQTAADGQAQPRRRGRSPWSPAAGMRNKLESVANRGAAGIIVVNPPGIQDQRQRRLETTNNSAQWMRRPLSIPAVMIDTPAADVILRAADPQARSLLDFRKLADESGGVIKLNNANITIDATVGRTGLDTNNVAGILPGAGTLADEFIVIGGHFDHVGLGDSGGSRTGEVGTIHPGADDNASGTAAFILAAELLTEKYSSPTAPPNRRSIVFIGFSGEEIGLLGARYFVDNPPPTVNIKNINAMLNLDMVGRLRRNELFVYGTGTAKDFDSILDPHLASTGLTVEKLPGGIGPSDHAVFFGQDIPVLHLFTGLHTVYHAPGDTFETINSSGGALITQLTADIAYDLATQPQRLEFIPDRTPDPDMFRMRPD